VFKYDLLTAHDTNKINIVSHQGLFSPPSTSIMDFWSIIGTGS